MNPLTTHLQRGFDYDLWANLRWLDWLDGLPDPHHARDIMLHVARAQYIWLTRIEGINGEFDDAAPLDESLRAFNAAWKDLLAETPVDRTYRWTRLVDAAERQCTLEDVARHVINHGTYHRGHLRGLADAAVLDHFEDTDFARYFDIHPSA